MSEEKWTITEKELNRAVKNQMDKVIQDAQREALEPCPYCTFDKNGEGETYIDDTGDVLWLVKSATGVYVETELDEGPYINYCPMCGRKLKEE